MGCLPVHVSCLVQTNNSNELFHLAQKLVELYPEWCVAWFAVGSYYYLIGKQEFARRYLCKATQLDRVFGPAWLTYGHSFAVENEHDQAMAAYFKACQLMKGCHLPLLYTGVEYGLTNNSKLAERFFSQALEIAPNDPFVLHELGVTSFQKSEYPEAERYFLRALQILKQVGGSALSQSWEPLLNNLGHTARNLLQHRICSCIARRPARGHRIVPQGAWHPPRRHLLHDRAQLRCRAYDWRRSPVFRRARRYSQA